jgi:hypothetical protein
MINVLRREALEREAELERAREERRVKRTGISPERVAELRGDDEILTAREAGVILKLSRKTVIEVDGEGRIAGTKNRQFMACQQKGVDGTMPQTDTIRRVYRGGVEQKKIIE